MSNQSSRDQVVNRRRFFQWGVWIIGGIFSFLLGIPLLGYIGSALFRGTPERWVQVCTLDQVNWDVPRYFRIAFEEEEGPGGFEDVRGVFVIRNDDATLAFTSICTHMGCSVRWIDWRQQILCPCHGGTYDRWGNLTGGPPAASLPFFVTKVEDGIVYVANRLERR